MQITRRASLRHAQEQNSLRMRDNARRAGLARFTERIKANAMSITLLIIAITCVTSFLALQNLKMMNELILWPPAVSGGKQYYRLLSYGLIHADFQHLLFNMITLYFFGSEAERFYTAQIGSVGFELFYAGALVASILPSYLKNRENAAYRSLGASGAVSAVLFGFILLHPWSTIIVFVVPLPAIVYAGLYLAYTFYLNKQGTDNVNHSAHLWGAAYGVVFAIALDPSLLESFLNQLANPRF